MGEESYRLLVLRGLALTKTEIIHPGVGARMTRGKSSPECCS